MAAKRVQHPTRAVGNMEEERDTDRHTDRNLIIIINKW